MKIIRPYFTILLRFLILPALIIAGIKTSIAQNIDFGKSYINVSKGANGGTLETGDILEIRASLVVRSGTYDSCRYQDVVPVGTSYIPGTIRVLTNEGKIYKQFTDAFGDDPGWISGSNITINLGYVSPQNATAFRRGRVRNTYKPSFYGSSCIMIASFRVVVTAATGSNISTGGGNMTYKSGFAAVQTFTFPSNIVRVYPNYGICSNTIGVNSIGTEFNGTFGSGEPRNRGVSGNVPVGYTYNVFTNGGPNDYYYGVANNTSTQMGYSTVNTWAYPDPDPDGGGPLTTHRVFGVWDIIGDHTGAVDPLAGNPPADTVVNNNAGYMLVINAAYRIDSAFQQTISGLCPNTYYEISCWMRNICPKCGCDSNGKGASNSSGPPYYIPTGPGDSSGVRPNLTFEIDGIDYYTTGDLDYTGQWEKKGFTFLTGPLQTSFTLKFFNNAPGGGGNDWALDDISVSTCSPNMKYSPSLNPIVCDSNTITIYDTVRSFFNNYTYYKWQRSTNGGVTWTDVTGALGPAAPAWNGTAWQYVTSYTIPPLYTQIFNNGDKYRVVVATTMANLSNTNCSFTDQGNIITVNVILCGLPLDVQMVSFSGDVRNQLAVLNWTTEEETELLQFDIEKSLNGSTFTTIATVNSYNDNQSEQNNYTYTDPTPLSGPTYYRIKVRNTSGKSKYTKTIRLLSTTNPLAFISVINPFSDQLIFDISSDKSGKIDAELIDPSGRIIKHRQFEVTSGVSRLTFENTGDISTGIYFLRVKSNGTIIQKNVMKGY
ncbi:MAG TPA: T9SS type A sorting domain-containing protein [Chitinophagaceae bacterium]|nr:T9SS type A sorting domain-containing protein [Chitinophagaceae bacterium]